MDDVIYLRVSTKEQSLQQQMRDIKTLKPKKDCLIFKEEASAYKENVKRPEFEKIYDMVKSGRVKSIYVWSLDRIFRNRKRLVEFLTACKVYKVDVFSYNEKWLLKIRQMGKPFDEIIYNLMVELLSWIAEEDSKLQSNRVKKSVKKNRKGITVSTNGKKWGRKPFPKQTIDRVLKLHKEQFSIREIAKRVNIYDKNRNEKLISRSAVHKIINDFKNKYNVLKA